MDFDINYYPLIDCNGDGTLLRPLMAVRTEEEVKQHHSLWLLEAVPNSYRLCCTDEGYEKIGATFDITCPLCGNGLYKLGSAINKNKRGLFVCNECKR